MEYDDLLTNHLGEFGFYQRIVFLLVSLSAIATCFCNLGIVFLAAIPEHWCYVEELESLSHDDVMDLSIPLEKDDNGDEVHSSCKMYDRNYANWSDEYIHFDEDDKTVRCLDGYTYDKGIYHSSIVTEWDLVCSDLWLRTTVISTYMAGFLVGVVISGSVSDLYGRKKTLYVSIFGTAAIGTAQAFSGTYVTYLVLRFFLATFAISVFTCSFVIVVEIVGPRWRLHTGLMIEYFWAAGYMLIALIAFYVRDWRKLQLCLCVPIFALLLHYWAVSESPRWLFMKNRHEEATKIIEKMAKLNKKKLPENLKIIVTPGKKAFIWDLFRIKQLRWRTMNICFNWCVNSLVYYGLSLSSSSLAGDPYLNFFISGAVEVPAYIFVQLNPLCCGRRVPLASMLLLAGVALLSTLAVPDRLEWLTTILAMIGKFAISASFAIIYIFTAELYPTQVRNVGVACGSFAARVGGISAPYIAALSTISPLIPIITFGVASLIAGVLSLKLPETKGKKLPQTLEELTNPNSDTVSLDVNDKGNGIQTNVGDRSTDMDDVKVTFDNVENEENRNGYLNEAFANNELSYRF